MFPLFYKYLILNKKAAVPGIGVFTVKRQPAQLDFANEIFTSPDYTINFNEQALVDDNRLYSFISKEKKIDVTQAAVLYSDFANTLKKDLYQQKSVILPQLGMLSQNEDGKITFTSIINIKDYFPAAGAERIFREHTEHNVLVGDVKRTNAELKEMVAEDARIRSHTKDPWWIFAIALGIIGIATIVYYYLHNGSLR